MEDAAPLGLPFPERCADALGDPDDADGAGGGGNVAADLCVDGEVTVVEEDELFCFKSAP